MNNFDITDLDQIGVGTYGYIVKLDTTNIKSYDIEFILAASDSGGTVSAPSDASVTVKALNEYLEDSACPDLAFNYTHGICTMFFKTTAWPYTSDTLVSLFGKRNALKMEEGDDLADFPDELIELYSAYVIKYAALLRGKPIPADVNRVIQREEYAIKNA